jgi:hypothetical protein
LKLYGPEGAECDSPGRSLALREAQPWEDDARNPKALKERDGYVETLIPPFQGFKIRVRLCTQGVALGCHIGALSGLAMSTSDGDSIPHDVHFDSRPAHHDCIDS